MRECGPWRSAGTKQESWNYPLKYVENIVHDLCDTPGFMLSVLVGKCACYSFSILGLVRINFQYYVQQLNWQKLKKRGRTVGLPIQGSTHSVGKTGNTIKNGTLRLLRHD